MIDPQAMHGAVGDRRQDALVGGRENLRILDPQSGQGGDVEEAPVVQLLAADAPQTQPVVLRLDQFCQGQLLGTGGEWENVVVVAQPFTVDDEFAGSQALGERAAQHRHQHLAGVVAALPVDVEPAGVLRLAPLAQHTPPRLVGRFRLRDAGVVGHDVKDDPEAGGFACLPQPHQGCFAAELRIDRLMIGDVIPVLAPGGGGEPRRAVEKRNPEIREVGDDRGRVVEPELRGQLNPVCAGEHRSPRNAGPRGRLLSRRSFGP
jgi:hypothetical protein